MYSLLGYVSIAFIMGLGTWDYFLICLWCMNKRICQTNCGAELLESVDHASEVYRTRRTCNYSPPR